MLSMLLRHLTHPMTVMAVLLLAELRHPRHQKGAAHVPRRKPRRQPCEAEAETAPGAAAVHRLR